MECQLSSKSTDDSNLCIITDISVTIKSNDGIMLQRHINQLRSRYSVGVEVSKSNDNKDWQLPQTAPMVENTDTLVKVSVSDSMDPPTLDGPPSPPHTPTVPTVQGPRLPIPSIRHSQQSHRPIGFGLYVTS